MVYGWGSNGYGSVGVGDEPKAVPEPAPIAGPLADGSWQFVAIAAGAVVSRLGTVVVWALAGRALAHCWDGCRTAAGSL